MKKKKPIIQCNQAEETNYSMKGIRKMLQELKIKDTDFKKHS